MIWALTGLGALAGLLAPAFAPGPAPHPALHGTVGDAVSILLTNLRLLSVPFIFAALGFAHSRPARACGDLLVGAMVAVNTLRVGLALGRYGATLIPYISQLPLEWLALALSATAWMSARRGQQLPRRPLALRALQAIGVAAVAAGVEAFLTPHMR